MFILQFCLNIHVYKFIIKIFFETQHQFCSFLYYIILIQAVFFATERPSDINTNWYIHVFCVDKEILFQIER